MSAGIKIVRNGNPKEDDVRLGWVAKIMIGAAIILLAFGVQRGFYISAKIDVIDERTQRIDTKADAANALAARVKMELDEDVKRAQDQHEKFLTRDEYYHDMSPEIRRPRRGP